MARPNVYKLEATSFGAFKGTKVYYFGFDAQPGFLPKTGRGFGGLKHLLELLKAKFKKFTLTFTQEEDSAKKEDGVFKVRLSVETVRRLSKRRWDENRQLNVRLATQLLAEALPEHFQAGASSHTYQRGMFAEILNDSFDPRMLNPVDRAALTKFVMGTAATAATLDIPTAYGSVKDAQLVYLKRLVAEFDVETAKGHDESWWQSYFAKNILYFQDNYIRQLPKLNLIVVGTQYPDFSVITSDEYLDILEIKKPSTDLLKEDKSRHNYYWSTEIAKAISQVENYIDSVTKNSDSIRSKIRDDEGIDLRIIKPRGIIIAGTSAAFAGQQKMADDFRRLNECLKNIQIIPFDELSQRLKNTIESIERLARAGGHEKKRRGKSR